MHDPQHLSRALEGMERRISAPINQHAQMLNAHQSALNAQAIDVIRGNLARIANELFKSASNYNNFMVMLGYLSFFTVWNGVRDDLEPIYVLISGVAIGVSVGVFIVNELVNACINRKTTRSLTETLSRIANCKHDLETVLSIVNEMEVENAQRVNKIAKWWWFIFGSSSLFGIIGGIALVWGCVVNILQSMVDLQC